MHLCKNSLNEFCYVCGEFTAKNHVRSISKLMKTTYEFYFSCALGDQDKHHTCTVYISINKIKGPHITYYVLC